ncbi:hypothetical protein [Spiroplasma endosymbiont of Zeiraphera isertana]|uniref:hypothetical protein n=1 Tax=Spiroplasma endosymbiont of Zeiraphera isertana TaxID=3066313 RepID=UPI00313EA7E5
MWKLKHPSAVINTAPISPIKPPTAAPINVPIPGIMLPVVAPIAVAVLTAAFFLPVLWQYVLLLWL